MNGEFILAPGEADIRTALSKLNLTVPVFEENRFSAEAFMARDIEAHFFFKTDFSECALTKHRFAHCRFQKALFLNTDLSHTSFYHCIFKETDFSNARLKEAKFVNCIFEQVVFDGVDLLGIVLKHCFFSGIQLKHAANINENRVLMGLFLKQYAGNSSEKHKIADAVADEAIGHAELKAKINALPLVFALWMEQLCRNQPGAGLERGLKKLKLDIEKKYSPESLDACIIDEILPRNFVIVKGRDASYYAVSNGQNLITVNDIRAKLIDYHKEEKYQSKQVEMLSVLGEKCAPPVLEEMLTLHWPFPPQKTIEIGEWNQKAQVDLEQMIRDEELVASLICAYLKEHLNGVNSVIDVACSHGFVLQQLHAMRPELQLMGRDIAKEMVDKAAEKLPQADIQIGNALDLGQIKADVVILRATGQAVSLIPDAEKMIREGLRILNPGGKLIICSLTPPVFDPAYLGLWSNVLVNTKVSSKGLSAFYVLAQKKAE